MHRRRFLASLVPVTLGGVAGCVAPESGSTGDDRVVTVAPGERLVAYDRRIGGETLAFDPAGDGLLRGGGSRWRRSDGVAVDGNHRGRHLRPITDRSRTDRRCSGGAGRHSTPGPRSTGATPTSGPATSIELRRGFCNSAGHYSQGNFPITLSGYLVLRIGRAPPNNAVASKPTGVPNCSNTHRMPACTNT